jgi:alpha-N-arabinofuranosidase
MPTFGSWEATVLEETYDLVDYISCHAYYEPDGTDLASFLASAVDMDHFIDAVTATADHIGAIRRSRKLIHISFDEWNVWYQSRYQAAGAPSDWPVAPRLIEDTYNVADAVVVGGLLISLLRHSDRVHAAALAQLVNVIAPIRTEPGGPIWRQTIFYPFAATARWATGEVLRVEPRAPELYTARYGPVPAVDAVATRDPDSGEVSLFATNRSLDSAVSLDVDLRGLGPVKLMSATTLTGPDPYTANTIDHPDQVAPVPLDGVSYMGGSLQVPLPPVSWNTIRLAPAHN